MIGLILVTHGNLALEFKSALEHVVGPQTQLETICIGPDDDMEARRSDIVQAARRADSGAGVIVLTDMFGGTPSNLAISVMDDAKVEVLAGVNLPMLVKLGSLRRQEIGPKEMADRLRDAGQKSIRVASNFLRRPGEGES
jgi:PTS system mannose-specific IIA component